MTNIQIAAKASEVIPFRSCFTAEQYDKRLELIRQMATPYKRRRPRRVTRNEKGDFYSNALQQVLLSVRHGETDFIYNEAALIDLLRYEPQTEVVYRPEWEVWEVSLGACA